MEVRKSVSLVIAAVSDNAQDEKILQAGIEDISFHVSVPGLVPDQ